MIFNKKMQFSNFRFTGIYTTDHGYTVAFAKVDIIHTRLFRKPKVMRDVSIFSMHFGSGEYWRYSNTGEYVEPNSVISNLCLAHKAKCNLHTIENVKAYLGYDYVVMHGADAILKKVE